MKYDVSNTPNGDALMELHGEMDAFGCTELRPVLEEFVTEPNINNMLLDLSDVTFIDSSGVGAIVFLFKRLASHGKTLVIRGVNGQPRELMELLRVGSAIPVSYGQHVDTTLTDTHTDTTTPENTTKKTAADEKPGESTCRI